MEEEKDNEQDNETRPDLTLDFEGLTSPLNSEEENLALELKPPSPSGSPEISPVTSENMFQAPPSNSKGDINLKAWEKAANRKIPKFFEEKETATVRATVKEDPLPRRRPNKF